MSDYITTYTGKHFYPLHPKAEDIDIKDIAHALSLICRGNGQVQMFHSVGYHCIQCAVEARSRGYSRRIILGCLLHDASECYMSDVPRPFKQFLKDYQKLEDELLDCIYTKFLDDNLTEGEKAQIKEIDNDLLAHDLYYLLREGKKEELPKLSQRYVYGEMDCGEVEERYLELFMEYLK